MGSGQQVLDALREASKGKVEPTLSSGMVFSWAFLELVAWFWVSDEERIRGFGGVGRLIVE